MERFFKEQVKVKKSREEISLEILQSSQSSPEDVAYAFPYLYINARDDEHAAEIVKIFYENHPEAARNFLTNIEVPSRLLPRDFSLNGYQP